MVAIAPPRRRRVLISVALTITSAACIANAVDLVGSFPPTDETMIGLTYPVYSSEIVSEFGGLVESVSVLIGQSVVPGDVLLKLDTTQLGYDLETALSKMAVATAKTSSLRIEKNMYAIKLQRHIQAPDAWSIEAHELAKYEADRATIELTLAEAESAGAYATVKQFRAKISAAVIKAPVECTVSGIFVDPNDMAAIGQPLVRLISGRRLAVRFGVPETLLHELSIGRPLLLSRLNPNLSLRTTIARWSPEIDVSTGLVVAETEVIQVTKEDTCLVSGMALKVRFF
jgi:RND family efflux transporter MFP subunit